MVASKSNIGPEQWLNLLISKGPELRKAGILQLSLDSAVFAPYQEEPEWQDDTEPSEDSDAIDPFNDALSMGFPPGTKLPNFSRIGEADDE